MASFSSRNLTPPPVPPPYTVIRYDTIPHPTPSGAGLVSSPQQAGPVSSGTLTPDSRETPATPEGFSVSPTGTATTTTNATLSPPKAKPKPRPKVKVNRKDRAKRLLLSLATKHHFQSTAAAGGGTGENTSAGERSLERPSERRSPGGGADVVPSPLVTATDAATVRPGMVLASVAARGGQGVSEEAVDTWGMGVKEAIETLVRCVLVGVCVQHSIRACSAAWYVCVVFLALFFRVLFFVTFVAFVTFV